MDTWTIFDTPPGGCRCWCIWKRHGHISPEPWLRQRMQNYTISFLIIVGWTLYS